MKGVRSREMGNNERHSMEHRGKLYEGAVVYVWNNDERYDPN